MVNPDDLFHGRFPHHTVIECHTPGESVGELLAHAIQFRHQIAQISAPVLILFWVKLQVLAQPL